MIKDLLQQLESFNNSLGKLLSMPQRAQAARALASGVLVDYEDPRALKTVLESSAVTTIAQHSILADTARVKQLCLEADENEIGKKNENSAVDADSEQEDDEYVARNQLDPSRAKIERQPKTSQTKRFWPLSLVELDRDGVAHAKMAIIEWREPKATLPGRMVTPSSLTRRRDLVVELLQTASRANNSGIYPVLNCAGYVKHTGRLDGKLVDLVGFISRIPDWADGTKEPVTLQRLLTDAYESDDMGNIPSLRTRFSPAKTLVYGLY